MSNLDLLFNARGIAIIGASEDPSRSGSQPMAALKSNGYRGGIFPVNPRYREVSGYKCFASPADIDGDVDIAVIALPAKGAVEMVKTCGELGVRHAVVLGGGFREVGPQGLALQNQLVANARAHGMRLIGPNCTGIANIHTRMYAAFGSMTRPPKLSPGPVSIVMQSGGFGYGMVLTCRNAGIGFRMVIASGNEADLAAPELIDALVDDPETGIILAYLEGVMDGRALVAAGERALQAGKPLLIWKGGKNGQGARVAASHTANMTGSYDVWQAAFRQSGIINLTELEQIPDYIRALSAKRFPRGRNIAVLGPSGGSAVVVSDAADQYGLTLHEPGKATAARLVEALPYANSRDNPIDLGAGGISPPRRANVLSAFDALLADPDIHQILLMLPTAIGERARTGAEVMAEVAERADKPLLIFSALLDDVNPEAWEILRRAKVPVLASPVRVARAAAMLADYAEARRLQQRRHLSQTWDTAGAGAGAPQDPAGTLDEARSKAFLAKAGIGVTRDIIVPMEELRRLAGISLAYPVAVKVLSSAIAHKTDIGGVVLNVMDAQALRSAAESVIANAHRAHPGARIEGVLVSEMITDAVEAIAGVVSDAAFGPVIMLGMGGVLAEASRDATYRLAPIGPEDARTMIVELRASAIFKGMRGRPACDVDALAHALVSLSRLAWEQRDRLEELDINPLMVRPEGKGVLAADALVILR